MIMKEETAARLADHEVRGRSPWADARTRFARNKGAMVGFFVLTLICLFAVFGSHLTEFTYDYVDFGLMGEAAEKGAPSWATGHYFGTDDGGRDFYARVVQASQISLAAGLIGSAVAVIIGTLYGAISGFVGGRTDQVMMRIVDILMSVPFMFVIILLLVMFGRSIWMLFLGIGMFSWLDMSRIVRGQTLSLKRREFIEAAHATGVSSGRIILRHIVPNLMGVVVVYASLLVPIMIMTESFISFLGLGVQAPLTSWGALLSEGASQMRYGTLWLLLFPLGFFVTTMFCMSFIGDGLRDALDPKDR